jgi:hypothetical protein
MAPIASFATAAGGWQNFYILVGTAAATLVGLMFVAVTFGANLVTPETQATARAFLDPPFTHFAHVLLTACLVVIPTMRSWLLGSLLVVFLAVRVVGLGWVHRQMRGAQQRSGDVELSDWITGIVVPALAYVLLGASAAAFLRGYTVAFDLLAVVTVAMLFTGIYSAWELMVWMAIMRSRPKP